MTDVQEARPLAGWGGESLPPALRKRWEQERAAEERQAREAERFRAQLAEQRHADAIRASIALAQQNGEEIADMRAALGEGHGHTHAEALQLAQARQDADDARAAAQQAAEFRRWQLEQAEAWTADTTAAPSTGEIDAKQLDASRARDEKLRKQLDERAARRDALDEQRWGARVERSQAKRAGR